VYGAGVSFHIGSGATDALSFADAIAAAREVFDVALRLKLPAMKILDIGGGFTSGSTGLKFLDASAAVNTALDAYFPPNMGVTIIAEPGRYFAETPATLATTVIGKRVRANIREYWINDGIYGSMNCLLYDHAKLKYRPLLVSMEEESGDLHTDWMAPIFHSSTVFGPTCDGLDTVLQGALLPELSIGDWILFPNMGAYTAAAGSSFNGFATSDIPTFYAFSVNLHGCPAAALSILKGLLPEVMKMLLSEVNFDTFGAEVNSEVSGSSSGSQLISVSNGGGYS
jgi:ornithine decarboxylase